MSKLSLCVLVSVASCVSAARILAVLPFPGQSHYIFHISVLKALAERGHEVVEYSPYPPKQPIANYTHVYLHTSFNKKLGHRRFEDLPKHSEQITNFFGLIWLNIWKLLYQICEETFQNENIKKLLKSNEHFDLIITASTFGQESMLVFGHKFKAPTITLQANLHSITLNRDAGNDLMIATIPDSFSFAFTDRMTFKERLRNFISIFGTLFIYHFSHIPKHDSLLKKYYNTTENLLVGELVTNVSLTLVNSHPTVFYPQPLTPNVVPIGGITVEPERHKLPQDVENFMDNAKEGVVYFSFGTVIPTHTMPQEHIQVFVNVFKRLPQLVLWKTEADEIPGLPENVRLIKWAPQPGILEHPNCVVFITHGGLSSQIEAIHAGVPTVGIPFFSDQFFNIRFNEDRGIGVKVDFKTLSEETLYSALKSVLNYSKYKQNALRLSRIFRDAPASPRASAVYWVEYILRHGGGHLRPRSSQLPLTQLLLLDVVAALGAAGVIVAGALYWLCGKAVRSLGSRTDNMAWTGWSTFSFTAGVTSAPAHHNCPSQLLLLDVGAAGVIVAGALYWLCSKAVRQLGAGRTVDCKKNKSTLGIPLVCATPWLILEPRQPRLRLDHRFKKPSSKYNFLVENVAMQ